MIELYHGGLTACSIKSRICLKEKGVKYVSRFVNLSRFEQHDPEYLKLNPNGLVPTLVHNGAIIIESSVINEYVDEAFEGPALRPIDPAGRARVRVWAKLADDALGPNMVFTFSQTGSIGVAARRLTEDELRKRLNVIPLDERRNVLHRVTLGGGYSAEEFTAAQQKASAITASAEKALETGRYLAGAAYTLADINMIPFICRYKERIIPDLVTPERHPRVCDWYNRVMARPAVKEAFASREDDPVRLTPPTR